MWIVDGSVPKWIVEGSVPICIVDGSVPIWIVDGSMPMYRVDGSMPIWKVDAFWAEHGAAANINRETKETTRILFIFAWSPFDLNYHPCSVGAQSCFNSRSLRTIALSNRKGIAMADTRDKTLAEKETALIVEIERLLPDFARSCRDSADVRAGGTSLSRSSSAS
jgi:hypothetical protein